jgi:fimbrial chaperone protein
MPAMRASNTMGTGRRVSGPVVRFLASATLLAFWAAAAAAFSFEPIVQDFAPSGEGSVRTFRVTNTGAERIAVRIQIAGRVPDIDGKESMPAVPGLFAVYPERMLLEPGAAQAVRVQWKGPPTPAVEQCFRIIAEQMPVDFGTDQKKETGAIKVLYRYVGAIYVVPSGARPRVVLESVRSAVDASGKAGLELVFANRGTAHTMLDNLELTVAGRAFGPAELPGISGENVLPGFQRRFFLALDSAPPEGEVNAAFRFDPLR